MLEGLTVVELATYIAAPGAAGVMADWGAAVIKVESPAGDPWRRFFDNLNDGGLGNPVFDMDNRGKRSIALDISKPEGLEAIMRLISKADIFLTNVRAAALKRAGLDFETLHAKFPQLIYTIVSGYGLEGAEADKPGFDTAVFWARAGVAALTAPKGTEPFPLRTGVGDHACSLATVSATLAAVIERGRTGQGRLVETSLIRSGVHSIATDMSIQLRLGKIASTRPREAAINPLANFFKTADGRWFCLVPRDNGADWPDIARAAVGPELATDPRFAKGRDRRTHGAVLVGLLDTAFGEMTLAEVGRRLDEADVVWSPVQTPAEVSADPQAQAAGCFVEIPKADGGTNRSVASPARFPGADDGPKGPAPTLGQHSREILLELGYSASEIEALKVAGAAL